METLLEIVDATGPQEWLTAGKVVTGGEKKSKGEKEKRKRDKERRFILSNGSITPLRWIRILKYRWDR